MPQRSVIEGLSPELRAALDQELVRRQFSGFADLVDLLERHGVRVSTSQIGRYSQRLRERVESIRARVDEAKQMVDALGDDPHALSKATIIKAQLALDAFIDDLNPETTDPRAIGAMSRAARDLSAALRDYEKWREAIEAEHREKLDRLESEARTGTGRLDLETVRRIREEIYGVVA